MAIGGRLRIRLGGGHYSAPTNTVAPTVTGSPAQGSTLSVGSYGSWTGNPTSFAVQWRDNGSNVLGQTGATFNTASIAVGHAVDFTIVATGPGGVSTPPTASSNSIIVTSVGTKLGPSAGWTGVAGSGYGAPYVSVPVQTTPVLGVAQPWLRPLFQLRQTITGDTVIGVMSGALGGLSRLRAYCEGNVYDIPSRSWQTLIDANGNSNDYYGWWFTLDWTASQAAHPNGLVQCYWQATASDGTMVDTVIGPYNFCTRTAEFDIDLIVAHTPGTTLAPWGTATYTGADALQAALQYVTTHTSQWCRIVVIESGDYRLNGPATGLTTSTHNTVIIAASGIALTIGDGTLNYTQPGVDGLEYRGSNVTLNFAKMSAQLQILLFLQNTGTFCTFNGCEITGGTAAQTGQSGSGQTLLYYGNLSLNFWIGNYAVARLALLECNIHDMPSYGFINAEVYRGGTMTDISGSGLENCKSVQGTTLRRIGGGLTTLKQWTNALSMTYGGAGTGYIQKPNGPGGQGPFIAYESGKSIIASITGATLTVTAVSGVTLAIGQYLADVGLNVRSGTQISALGTGTGGVGTYTLTYSGLPYSLSSQTMLVSTQATTLLNDFAVAGAPSNTTLTQAAAAINGSWTSWTAAAIGGGNTPNAAYLSLNTLPGASYPIPLTALPGGALTLQTIMDIHSDSIVTHGPTAGGAPIRNICIEFVANLESIQNDWVSFNGSNGENVQDVYLGNLTCDDQSIAHGLAVGQGYLNSNFYHTVFEHWSANGGGEFYSATMTCDTYCATQNCLNEALTIFGTQSPTMNWLGLVVRTGALPTRATTAAPPTGTGSKALSGAAVSTFMDTNFVPVLSGALLLNGGAYAGAKVPTAQITTANKGWLLSQN